MLTIGPAGGLWRDNFAGGFMRSISKFAVVALAGLSLASTAQAATQTTINVTATVVDGCGIRTTSQLAFVNYAGDPLDSTAALEATCTDSTVYNITISAGSSGNTAQRTMRNGPAVLNYNIYSDVGRSVVWPATGGVPGIGSGGAQLVTVYGRVAASQTSAPGVYSDTLTANINF